MFLMGSISSPKAANENEALTLLCERFNIGGGYGLLSEISGESARTGTRESYAAAARSLRVMRVLERVACGIR